MCSFAAVHSAAIWSHYYHFGRVLLHLHAVSFTRKVDSFTLVVSRLELWLHECDDGSEALYIITFSRSRSDSPANVQERIQRNSCQTFLVSSGLSSGILSSSLLAYTTEYSIVCAPRARGLKSISRSGANPFLFFHPILEPIGSQVQNFHKGRSKFR